jgi:hypothetical protein
MSAKWGEARYERHRPLVGLQYVEPPDENETTEREKGTRDATRESKKEGGFTISDRAQGSAKKREGGTMFQKREMRSRLPKAV